MIHLKIDIKIIWNQWKVLIALNIFYAKKEKDISCFSFKAYLEGQWHSLVIIITIIIIIIETIINIKKNNI